MRQQNQAGLFERAAQRGRGAFEQFVAGEQGERPAARLQRPAQHALRHRFREGVLVLRIRRVGRHVQAHLPRMVERRAQAAHFAIRGRAEAVAAIIQPPAHRQRGAGQRHGRDLAEQRLAQDRGHFDRRRMQHGLAAAAFALDPINVVRQRLREERVEHSAHFQAEAAQMAQFRARLLVLAFQFLDQFAEADGEFAQQRGHLRFHGQRARHGFLAVARAEARGARHRLEQIRHGVPQARRGLGRRAGAQVAQQALARVRREQPPQPMLEAVRRQAQAQMLAGRVLDDVRLVEHDGGDVRQEGGAAAAQRQIGKQQMVVGDQQVRILHPGAGALQEAALALGTFRAEAVAVFRADGGPGLGRRRAAQFLHAAVFRLVGPGADPFQIRGDAVAEEFALVVARARQAAQAQVIHAALDQRGAERRAQLALQQRQVLADELFLQGNRVGGHQRPDAVALGVQDQRHQIGQALADAGARLHDQMAVGGQRLGHRAGHVDLLRARFVLEIPGRGGQGAGRQEDGGGLLARRTRIRGGTVLDGRNHRAPPGGRRRCFRTAGGTPATGGYGCETGAVTGAVSRMPAAGASSAGGGSAAETAAASGPSSLMVARSRKLLT